MGTPEQAAIETPINIGLSSHDLAALDAYLATDDTNVTRAQAIRYILNDWLIGHGFLKHQEDPEGANGR